MRTALIFAALVGLAIASCPNSCSGHGRCGVHDKCICFYRWMGNDCSQRKCKEGEAWVQGGQSNAHDWAECSNKGICDRTTGECQCFDQYEGAACERSSCPNDCSGHGTCEYIQEFSTMNNENAWDFNKIQGCRCDGGFEGVDCSSRRCPRGDDPLTIPSGNVYDGQTWTISLTYAAGAGTNFFYLEVVDEFGTSHRSRAFEWDLAVSTGAATAAAAGALGDTNTLTDRAQLAAKFNYLLLDMPCFHNIKTSATTVAATSTSLTLVFTTLFPAAVQSITVRTDTCVDGCYPFVPVQDSQPTGTSSVTPLTTNLESAECSNRGVCDGTTGQCQCYAGHFGLACQYQTVLV